MIPSRDGTETDDDRFTIDRRSYVKAAAGAAVFSALGIGSAAADDDYDVLEVPAGDTHTITLGDGDVLENTLIDISADDARYQIDANGSDWEIRNVGVRGVWDGNDKVEPLIASVPDADGSARIENLYLGDGATDDTYPGATGIFVSPSHAGTLEIDRVNIQGYPDNAIYGSSPGNTNEHPATGSGGEVHITNSFAADCRAGGFRVGTDGSYVENCVAVGCDRNLWGFYEQTQVVDCDFSDGQIGDVGTGDSQWQANASVTLENTRFETTVEHSGQVVDESAGEPERFDPEDVDGVPLTAREAAAGTTESPADEPRDGDEDESKEGPSESLPKAVVIDGTDADGASAYSFEVTEEVEVSTYRDATVNDDAIVDGTSVEGTVEDGIDAYRFSGDLHAFALDGDARVSLAYDLE